MKIQAPPGMRDFYPPDLRVQNWLFDAWRRVSHAFGFEEYEGPGFEFLDLYTLKSGDAIVAELFHFTDRGQRRFALRPEMTPTLARMVAARANALPRPIKWFSIPRMCRAEKPQRGRLREFFQWNVDVLGTDDVLADAEVIAVAVEFARHVGLTAEDVVMRVSSRHVATAVLASLGIAPENAGRGFQLIDRYEKLGPTEFARQWREYAPCVNPDELLRLMEQADMEHCLHVVDRAGEGGREAATQFRNLWEWLGTFGVRDFCRFDLKIVRGLAYYTGPVFEMAAVRTDLRALAGGGRYDNLTELLEGPRVPGVGFGMGDAPMLELLGELGKLPTLTSQLDVFLIDAGERFFPDLARIASRLRQAGLSCDFSYKRQPVKKQFQQAEARCANYAIVIGTEYAERAELTVKSLRTGRQIPVQAAVLLADPHRYVGQHAGGASDAGGPGG